MKKLSYIIALTLSVGAFASEELDNLIGGVDVNSDDFSAFMEEFYSKESAELAEKPEVTAVSPSVTPTPVKEPTVIKELVIHEEVKDPEPEYSTSSDALLVSNIPVTSQLLFMEEVKVMPYNSIVYYKSGKRLYSNPLKDESGEFKNELTTFCSFNLKDYGIGRKMEEGKDVEITGIDHNVEEIDFSGFGEVKVQRVSIKLDNPHLKSLTCISTAKKNQFTIGDVIYETGGIVDFKLRDFISI